MNEFRCNHCNKTVPPTKFIASRMLDIPGGVPPAIGTKHRNHCPFCLWSRHLDLEESGDRKSKCQGLMKPIALTFKKEGKDKWGKERPGEVMLVHQCFGCGKISINRIAGDDNEEEILKMLESSKNLEPNFLNQLQKEGIRILSEKDRKEILNQLYGKKF